MSVHILQVFKSFVFWTPHLAEGIVGAAKCLTMEGKLTWRKGSAWHSKSGTKNFAKFLSIHFSCLRRSPSLTLLFFPLKFLLGDYPQVSLFPLPACVSSSSPALTTERWGVVGLWGGGGLMWWEGGGQQEPGGGRKRQRGGKQQGVRLGWLDWREGLTTQY